VRLRPARTIRRLRRVTRSLRLRARIILAFGLGGFLLSLLLAGSTYSLTRSVSLRQRENESESQFFLNAQQVQQATAGDDADLVALLQSLPRLADAQPIINTAGGAEDAWNSPSLERQDLPEVLIRAVVDSNGLAAQRMRYDLDGSPRLAMGLHLSGSEVLYFEVVPLSEVAKSLNSLAAILAAATVVTTAAGVGLGVWIGGRVLRPLADISDAAQAIAGGRLETRLERVDDPDLASLVDSFNNMASALEGRIERDARFASDISHELRSPLMTLRASIEVLQSRRDELSSRSRQALDLLTDDVDRFQQLVEDLLEISRVDAGAVDLSFDQIQLADLVSHAVQSQPRYRDVPVRIAQDVQDAVVVGDKRRLAQVIRNLLDNADKYADGATAVELLGDKEHVRLVVEDAGQGISDEDKGRVFERFARGNAAGARGSGLGAGLGLALVAEHVRLHDGHVWVEDRLDGNDGARFVVELPRGGSSDLLDTEDDMLDMAADLSGDPA
jgi:two-component system, OmpR family, sensor histidine kinase MtrB